MNFDIIRIKECRNEVFCFLSENRVIWIRYPIFYFHFMTEKIHTFPNKKPYTGDIFNIGKEELKKIISPIKDMSNTEVVENLVKYENTSPGKDGENTFEMMALYQRVINSINNNNELRVDGYFWKGIYNALKDIQAKIGAVSDGFPWPETTKALIKYLNSKAVAPEIKDIDFITDQINADKAILEAKKWVDINGSFYSSGDINNIDYALIKQSDGEFYLWDKPVNGARSIYRLNTDYKVIGVYTVSLNNRLLDGRWEYVEYDYNIPAPIEQK